MITVSNKLTDSNRDRDGVGGVGEGVGRTATLAKRPHGGRRLLVAAGLLGAALGAFLGVHIAQLRAGLRAVTHRRGSMSSTRWVPGSALERSTCPSRFVKYVPSALEEDWAALLTHTPGPAPLTERLFCDAIVSPAFRPRMQAWVTIAARLDAVRPVTRAAPGLVAEEHARELSSRDDVFSRFVYEDACTGVQWAVRVAPLAGLLREPRAPCAEGPSRTYALAALLPEPSEPGLQAKDTIVLDPEGARAATGRARRVMLFDAGAGVFGGYFSPGDGMIGGMRWLYQRYRDAGLTFTSVHAWEATAHSGDEALRDMPLDLAAVVHYYNFPASAVAGAVSNPLAVLKQTARPDDYVIFKLDIDGSAAAKAIEAALVDALLADDDCLGLIDDFFYELHYNSTDMAKWWGRDLDLDLDGARRVFVALRNKGVRAQFWP